MKRIIVIAIAVALVLALGYGGIVIANNRIAEGLRDDLARCPLPAGTEALDTLAVAGKLRGNGNGMQYLGALLVRSDLDANALRTWYEAAFLTADEIEVARQETPVVDEYGGIRFRDFQDDERCYRVGMWRFSVAGAERSPLEQLLNLDIRAH